MTNISTPNRGLSALLTLLLFVSIACDADGQEREDAQRIDDLRPTVLLISIDGFRWDYLDRMDTPALDRIAANGVRAEGLVAVYPTRTFPTHYSIVTGLHPENHGVVGNRMFDPEFNAMFTMGDREEVIDGRWWEGEPIWVTAEKQSQRAATFFWPGSEAEIAGYRPSFWKEYDGRIPEAARVDTLMAWLDLPAEERPTFLTLYFSNVDSQGHRHGPESEEVERAVEEVDLVMARLLEGLEQRGILDEVNIIVTSDHGMMQQSRDRVIFLDDFIDVEPLNVRKWGIMANLWVEEEDAGRVVEALTGAHPHMQAYRKEDVPAELNFRDHRRIPPVVLIPDPGWLITERAHFERNPDYATGASHGWDPRHPDMWGIFLAQGPAFRNGEKVDLVESIHIYELMAHILGLEPAPNDGDLSELEHTLAEPVESVP